MRNTIKILVALTGMCALPTLADVSLTYELNGPEMEPQTKTLSIARFFARIDDPKTPDEFLIYQAGKFFPLFRVDKASATYTRLTPEVKPTLHAGQTPKTEVSEKQPQPEAEATATEESEAQDAATSVAAKDAPASAKTPETDQVKEQKQAEPAADAPAAKPEPAVKEAKQKPDTKLRLTKKTNTVAGVRCRVVEELQDGKPIIRHCMADKSRLAITERETRTLARVFEMARERGYGWLGASTKDEKFVSVASKDLRSNKTLELKSYSTKPLDIGHLRIPREYKMIEGKKP